MAAKHSIAPASGVLTDITGGGLTEAGTYLLTIVNRAGTLTRVSVAITTDGSSPTTADWVEFEAKIEVGGVLSRWPLPLGAGWRVWILSDGEGMSATLMGRGE